MSEILKLPNAEQIEKLYPKKQLFYSRSGDIGIDTTETITNKIYGNRVTLEELQFSTNNVNTRLYIYTFNEDGTLLPLIQTIDRGGAASTATFFTFENHILNVNPMFEILLYDETNDYYKVSLRKPLHLPNGIRVQITNRSTVEIRKAAISLRLSEY